MTTHNYGFDTNTRLQQPADWGNWGTSKFNLDSMPSELGNFGLADYGGGVDSYNFLGKGGPMGPGAGTDTGNLFNLKTPFLSKGDQQGWGSGAADIFKVATGLWGAYSANKSAKAAQKLGKQQMALQLAEYGNKKQVYNTDRRGRENEMAAAQGRTIRSDKEIGILG